MRARARTARARAPSRRVLSSAFFAPSSPAAGARQRCAGLEPRAVPVGVRERFRARLVAPRGESGCFRRRGRGLCSRSAACERPSARGARTERRRLPRKSRAPRPRLRAPEFSLDSRDSARKPWTARKAACERVRGRRPSLVRGGERRGRRTGEAPTVAEGAREEDAPPHALLRGPGLRFFVRTSLAASAGGTPEGVMPTGLGTGRSARAGPDPRTVTP